jgi:hypothetical protein
VSVLTGIARIVRACLADGIPRRSFIVALIVGSILNLINQGDALLGGEPVDWLRLALTYLVPYLVATYGAVSVVLRDRNEQAAAARDDAH